MNDFEPTPETDPARSECAGSIAALQSLLDGEHYWDTADAASHRAICLVCREELTLAGSLNRLTSDVVVPTQLGDRVLEGALRSRRLRVYGRFFASVTALAACVLVAVFAFRKDEVPDPGTGVVAILPAPKPDPLPKIEPKKPLGESMSEARDAIVNLTIRTANETKDQSNRLAATPKMPTAKNPGEGLEPLADVRTGASRSVEPVQNSAKRAFNFLIRAADPPDRRQ